MYTIEKYEAQWLYRSHLVYNVQMEKYEAQWLYSSHLVYNVHNGEIWSSVVVHESFSI